LSFSVLTGDDARHTRIDDAAVAVSLHWAGGSPSKLSVISESPLADVVVARASGVGGESGADGDDELHDEGSTTKFPLLVPAEPWQQVVLAHLRNSLPEKSLQCRLPTIARAATSHDKPPACADLTNAGDKSITNEIGLSC